MRVRVSWAIVLLLVAALEFVPSYSGRVTPFALAAVVALPFLLIWAGARARLGAAPSATVVIVLGVVGAVWALRGTAGSFGGLGDAVPRLLTTPHPAPATQTFLASVLLLTVLVSAVVALCVLAPPESSTRLGGLLAPVVGAAVLYVAAQLLDAGRADPHGVAAMSLLLVAAVGWSVPQHYSGVLARLSWSPSAVVPAVFAVAVGLVVAAVVPTAGAFQPRDHVTPPTVALDLPNPLQLLSSWQANPDTEILRARVSGTQRLHLATLTDFTGDSWRVDDRYRELDLGGRPALPAGTRRADVTADITLTRLGGLWLPAPGTTATSSLSGVVTDPDDGTLARLTPVTAGMQYSLTGSIDAPDLAKLQAAGVPSSVPARYLALPGSAASFATYAQRVVRGASTPLEEAVALEQAVATGRSLAPTAPTGSSYARLATFLFGTDHSPGAQRGTSEQFVASFAVLARAVGLPTRLVVGFVLENASGNAVVRGRDAVVWPEVYFAGAGWVPFAPTPGAAATSGDAGVRDAVLGRLATRANVVPLGSASSGKPLPPVTAPSKDGARADRQSTPTLVIGLVAAGALLVLVLVLLIVLRTLRSAQHRRRGACGAWAEVLDLLVLLRHKVTRDATGPHIAAELDARLAVPGGVAARIADAADREAFAPDTRPSEQMWREVRVLRRRARARLPWHRRATFAVDPRPLLRRR